MSGDSFVVCHPHPSSQTAYYMLVWVSGIGGVAAIDRLLDFWGREGEKCESKTFSDCADLWEGAWRRTGKMQGIVNFVGFYGSMIPRVREKKMRSSVGLWRFRVDCCVCLWEKWMLCDHQKISMLWWDRNRVRSSCCGSICRVYVLSGKRCWSYCLRVAILML